MKGDGSGNKPWGWIIDVDHDADPGKPPGTNANAVGVKGPGHYKGDGSECTRKFRMYTDDNELIYEGRANAVSFDPLDDFGEPNYGCTRIDFQNEKGEWETL